MGAPAAPLQETWPPSSAGWRRHEVPTPSGAPQAGIDEKTVGLQVRTIRPSDRNAHIVDEDTRRASSREPRSLFFYIVSFVAYVAVLYPVIAVVFRLEEVAFGLYPRYSQFDPGGLLEEVTAVHWPSFILSMAAAAIPAVVVHRLRANTAVSLAVVGEAHRKQREFISVISHEFRTPLTAIQGYSELMTEDDLPREQVQEFSRDINMDARRLSRMISEILDFDRLESGRIEIVPAVLDLSASVRDVLDESRIVDPEHTYESAVGPLAVKADPDKLTQILTNLVSNATKYTPPGSSILVRALAEGGMVHVVVEDNGPGIPRDALERVFERYYRIESKDGPRVAGTGLGLPIVRQLVELQGGRVWCESELGKGAAFHFTLPLANPLAAAA
jgi:signal transduction histidine kinase